MSSHNAYYFNTVISPLSDICGEWDVPSYMNLPAAIENLYGNPIWNHNNAFMHYCMEGFLGNKVD
jgi:hypothetical protein